MKEAAEEAGRGGRVEEDEVTRMKLKAVHSIKGTHEDEKKGEKEA